MEHLFSPWRFRYVTQPKGENGCVFCRIVESDPAEDEEHFVLARADHHFVVLNIYPYTTGHLMVVPYKHEASLSRLPREALGELAQLAARAERLLIDVYRAEGVNLGMNLGQCAGAGIQEHLHLHAVPRWCGDTNFMTVTGRTRVLPEELRETWRKLHGRI
jgi:ATP adenylyltransferase